MKEEEKVAGVPFYTLFISDRKGETSFVVLCLDGKRQEREEE
jgi:hypothetical protein